ncbi:ABC transporter permease [Verrucomicrobiota bacterium]
MTKIFAIALLSARKAIRSRLFVSLVVVLFLVIFGLPAVIKGEGTLAGEVRILLYYTLGFAAIILGVATVWVSCGSVSSEIEDKIIRLIVVKPVHKLQIWFGKWLGVLIVNAVLLAVTGTVVYAYLQWTIRPSRTTAEERQALNEEILVGKRRIMPRFEPIDTELHEQFERLREQGKIGSETSHSEVLSYLKNQILAKRSVVAPGGYKEWRFDLPVAVRKRLCGKSAGENERGSVLSIRFNLESAGFDGKRMPITGTWRVSSNEKLTDFEFEMKDNPGGIGQFSVPGSVVGQDNPIVVRFLNDERDFSGTAVFNQAQDMELLIRESGFGANLVRALIIIFCHLALLAALGLTAGTFFSSPVATFAAASMLAVFALTQYTVFASASEHKCSHSHHHGEEQEQSVLVTASKHTAELLNIVVAPAMKFQALTPLSRGILISWKFTAKAILLLMVFYSGALGIIGGYVLKRRELALPGSRG